MNVACPWFRSVSLSGEVPWLEGTALGQKSLRLPCSPTCIPSEGLQSCPTLCDPMNHSSPGSPVHGILWTRTLEWVAILSSRGSSQPRDRILHCRQVDSLLSEPPGETKNPGVGSLTLLQGICPTQESNWGLLHCRRILLPAELPGKPEQAQ